MSRRSRRSRSKFKVAQQIADRDGLKRSESGKTIVESKVLKSGADNNATLVQTTKYQYIVPELKRIGIIAGVLFVIIFALSIIMG